MENMLGKISFVIPAYNEENYIGKTIEAILRQPSELVKEIIVADNNSTDKTAEIAGGYSKVKVIRAKNSGTNWARQTGLEIATGEIIAFIDADTQVTPGWSEKVIKILSSPKVVAVSGPYVFTDTSWFMHRWMLYSFLLVAIPISIVFNYILGIGNVVTGGNMAAKRDALLKIGGLDTSFTFFGDDTNTGKRLRKVGYVNYSPSLRAVSSSRRFQKTGLFNTTWKYFINFFWTIFFDKPFTNN